MIPQENITQWRSEAPWNSDEQVEQDLVLSRAMVAIFSDPLLASTVALRGGTALHKLCIKQALRYSEDIDLVQLKAGGIGETIDKIRAILDPWMGKPKRKIHHGRYTLIYRFNSEIPPHVQMRLKVEINTREHFSVFKTRRLNYEVDNAWFTGSTNVITYVPEELLGTKLRALYQRKKGRDLFDLHVASQFFPSLNKDDVVRCFQEYLLFEGKVISRAEFEANLCDKLNDPGFGDDILPLLPPESQHNYDAKVCAAELTKSYIAKLPGKPWKGEQRIA